MFIFGYERNGRLGQVYASPEIQTEKPIPLFAIVLPSGLSASGAQVGNHDIEATPLRVSFSQDFIDRSGIGQIAAERSDGVIAELGGQLRGRFGQRRFAPAGDADAAAFTQKGGSDRPADSTGRASDQRHAILERKIHTVNCANSGEQMRGSVLPSSLHRREFRALLEE